MTRNQDGSVTVSYRVEFTRGPKGQRRAVSPEPIPEPIESPPIDPESVPRTTRMLVLGYHFERLVREGRVKNYAEIAKLTGLSRARITHIVNMTTLPREIQDRYLLASS